MKNLFISSVLFFATLMMWLVGSTGASAQSITLSPNASSTITINQNGVTIISDGEIISLPSDESLTEVFNEDGNIIINGRRIGSADNFSSRKVTGSKEYTTRKVELGKNFNYIKASRGVQVVMSDKKGNSATIEASSNIIDYVICESNGGTLKVGIDDEIGNISNMHVVVTIPHRDNINVYQVSSAATITIHPTLSTSNVSLEATSAGQIHLTRINCDKLLVKASSAASITGSFRFKTQALLEASSAASVEVSLLGENASLKASSAAKIKAQGQVNILDADASSAADIKAQELNSVKAEAEASSGATIYVNCSNKLEAEASSGGDVRYTGNCQVERSTSSGGSVKKL